MRKILITIFAVLLIGSLEAQEIVLFNNAASRVVVYTTQEDILLVESLNAKVSPMVIGRSIVVTTRRVGEDVLRIILGTGEEVSVSIRVEAASGGYANGLNSNINGEYVYRRSLPSSGEDQVDQLVNFNMNVKPFDTGRLRTNLVMRNIDDDGWERQFGDVFYQSKRVDAFYGQSEYFQENIRGIGLNRGETFGVRYKAEDGDRFSYSQAHLEGNNNSHRFFSLLRPIEGVALMPGVIINENKSIYGLGSNIIGDGYTLNTGAAFDGEDFFQNSSLGIFNNNFSTLFRRLDLDYSSSSRGLIPETVEAKGRSTQNGRVNLILGGRINSFSYQESRDFKTGVLSRGTTATKGLAISNDGIFNSDSSFSQKTINASINEIISEDNYDRSFALSFNVNDPVKFNASLGLTYFDGDITDSLGLQGNADYLDGVDSFNMRFLAKKDDTSSISDDYQFGLNYNRRFNASGINGGVGIRPSTKFASLGGFWGSFRFNYRASQVVGQESLDQRVELGVLFNGDTPANFVGGVLDRFNKTKVVGFVDENFNNKFDLGEELQEDIKITCVQGGEGIYKETDYFRQGEAEFSGLRRSYYTTFYVGDTPENLTAKRESLSFPRNPSIVDFIFYRTQLSKILINVGDNDFKHTGSLSCKRSGQAKKVELSEGVNIIPVVEGDDCELIIDEHREYVTYSPRVSLFPGGSTEVQFQGKNIAQLGVVEFKGAKSPGVISVYRAGLKEWVKSDVDDFSYFDTYSDTSKIKVKGFNCGENILLAARGGQKYICKAK